METQRLMPSSEAERWTCTKSSDNSPSKAKSKGGGGIVSAFGDLFGRSKTSSSSSPSPRDTTSRRSPASDRLIMLCHTVFVILVLVNSSTANPVVLPGRVHQPQVFSISSLARNIRHLPCVSRRTKETGVCMFAIDCRNANGTHLGTCIDRFYFGSCCKLEDSLHDNHIEDNTISGKPIDEIPQKPLISENDVLKPAPTKSDVKTTTKKPSSVEQKTTPIPTSTTTSTLAPTTVQKKTSTSSSPTQRITTTTGRPSTLGISSIGTRPSSNITKITKLPSTPFPSKPIITINKITSAPTRPATQKPTTQTVQRPSSSATKKPVTTGIIINNTKYTSKPSPSPPTKPIVDRTEVDKTTLKPIVNINIASTTFRPFYAGPKPTPSTPQKPVSSTQGTVYINNQAFNVSKPSLEPTKRPATINTTQQVFTTTEVPYKISTYQSVQSGQDTKPTAKPSTNKPFTLSVTTKKPTSPYADLPFGTRLPSSTPSPKPLNATVLISSSKPTPSPTTQVQSSATTKPSPPKTKPTPQADTTRPFLRPQNSTLSNRRPTTQKPTTVIVKKPTPSTEKPIFIESTQKPTTVIFKPSLTGKPTQTTVGLKQNATSSVKPLVSTSAKPTTTYQKPIETTISQKPSTSAVNKKPTTSTTVVPKPVVTTSASQKPIKITSSSQQTNAIPQDTTVKVPTPTKVSSSKPSETTKKPLPSSQKPVGTTVPIKITTPSSLTNEIDSSVTKKPTTSGYKPTPLTTTTTESIGLVTWTSINGPESPVKNYSSSTTSAPTTTSNWILLPTVTNTNLTGPTMQPSNTIAPPKKPISAQETSSVSSVSSESSSSKPVTTKPELDTEFTTFVSISGGSTTAGSSTSAAGSTSIGSSTPIVDKSNGTTTASPTTVTLASGNETTLSSNVSSSTIAPTTLNGTTVTEAIAANTTTTDEDSTEKSTVSPIEVVTSNFPPSISTEAINMSDFRDVCGRRLWPEARVVGGARAPFGRWPWQVSLRQWRASTYLHKCGAALLSENWAITAAHCVDSVPPSDLLLRLGEHDLASEEEPYGFQERRVQIVASHPQFDPRTFEYDLALLRFYEPVTFQPNILPVCVPTNDEGFVGKTAYVTGWGRLYEDGPLPSVLQEVSVPVLENAVCENMYKSAGYIEHIPHIFICAGWRKGGFDSCEGDSGGPMVLQREDKRFLLAGVISWGIGCAEPNQPGVYTRISEFRDWINQILQF